jgi:hypothetical protein
MPEPTHDFDLDNILSDSRIVPDAGLKQSLRARLQSIRKTAPPAEQSNGWRRPSQVPYSRYLEQENKAMSNSRLIPALAIVFGVFLVVVLGAAILTPDLNLASAPPTATLPATTEPTGTALPPTPTPTTYSPKVFKLPMSVTYDAQWRANEEYPDLLTLHFVGHDAGLTFIIVKDATIASPDAVPFPDDFITWIHSSDSLFQVVDSQPIVVGGFDGIQINTIAACGDKEMWIELSGTGWWCPDGEPLGLIYLADVYGEPVLIQIQPSPDGKDYALLVDESLKVLDTVVFSEP